MRLSYFFLLALLISSNAAGQKKKPMPSPLSAADSAFSASNYAKAIPLYESALKDPKVASEVLPWYRLGLSCSNTRDFARALGAYAKAEKINGRHPGLRLNMAKAMSATGDVTGSKLQLDSALALGFGNHKILEQDPDFENLRKSDLFKPIRERAFANSHPCSSLPAAHAFDFWLGDWDVYQTSNPTVKTGFNRITSQSGGCVILESWESQGAHSGVSINYFDPGSGKWQQKWAGSGQDILEFYDGEYRDGAMRFKWDGRNPDGTTFPGRLTFTHLPSGEVRQHSQRSPDHGNTWVDVYDFTYIRRN